MKFKLGYWLIFLLIQCSYGADDYQNWTKISFEKKLPFSLKLELTQGLRLENQLSTINQAFFEISVSYKVSSNLRVNIPYRYSVYEDKIKHRLSFGASYQYSFKPVSLKYRLKIYRLYENGESLGEDGNPLGDLIRNKFTIKYKTDKKVTPYISEEFFHLYNIVNNPLNEYRVSLGIEINLARKNSMSLFYTLKNEDITDLVPDEIIIFGISYSSKL